MLSTHPTVGFGALLVIAVLGVAVLEFAVRAVVALFRLAFIIVAG